MDVAYSCGGNEPNFFEKLAERGRVIQTGVEYWMSKGWPDRLPSRADIDPVEMVHLLKHVVLLDVTWEPMDFVYRVIGTDVVAHLDRDHTGKRMSELDHQREPSRIWSSCRQVAETGHPLLSSIPYVGPKRLFRRSEDVILPLSSDGTVVDKLLVFVEYVPKSRA